MSTIAQKFLIFKRIGEIFWIFLKGFPKINSGPIYWRTVIEEVGGGFIKLAQILALRYEVLPPRYCEEFAKLFDRTLSFSKKDVQLVFQKECGKNPEEIFQVFSYEPHATASFGQVHIAVFNGRKVAVKIQKPGAQLRVHSDIAIVKFLAAIAGFVFPTPVNLKDAIREWESWTMQELDYRIEAYNARRFRATNTSPYFYIPEVFLEASTPRILVTEFLEGWSLNDIIRRKAVCISSEAKEKITKHIVWTQLIHYFKDGFFHADPHPGNIIVLKDGRLGYVDFGIMGEADSPYQNYHFANFIKFAANDSATAAVSHFREFMTAGIIFRKELMRNFNYQWHNKSGEKLMKGITRFAEDKMADIVRLWAEGVTGANESFYTRSTARHFISLVSSARRFGMEIPANFLAFIRSVVIIDMVCLVFYPDFDMKKELGAFFADHPEVCSRPVLSAPISIKAFSSAGVNVGINYEREVEWESEERQRLIERYLASAERIIERIIEEGSRGIAYFATTKV